MEPAQAVMEEHVHFFFPQSGQTEDFLPLPCSACHFFKSSMPAYLLSIDFKTEASLSFPREITMKPSSCLSTFQFRKLTACSAIAKALDACSFVLKQKPLPNIPENPGSSLIASL